MKVKFAICHCRSHIGIDIGQMYYIAMNEVWLKLTYINSDLCSIFGMH